jgi:hypothetical protein
VSPRPVKAAEAEAKVEPETVDPEPTTVDPAPATPDPEPATVDPQPEPGAELALIQNLPVIPARQELSDLAAMAVTLSAAGIVPGPLRGKPNDVFLVLLTGRDLGVPPTTALRMFHVIDGQITLAPKVKLAMVNLQGADRGWKVWPDPANPPAMKRGTATWYATRADRGGETYSSSVSWEDAEKVKITSTKRLVDKDNWQNYPGRMLSWRALGYLLDDAFPEIGTGLYSPDEVGAITDDEGNPLDVVDVEPLAQGMSGGPRRDPDRPVTEDVRSDLERRIKRLPEPAHPLLFGFWKNQHLPKLAELRQSQLSKGEAVVRSFESRATKGEWGQWSPAETPQQPTEAVVEGSASAEAPAGEAGPTPPPASPGCPHLADHLLVDESTGVVTCQSCGEVFEDEPF